MKRFASFSAEEIQQKRQLLTPKNTVKADMSAATVLREYLKEKGMNTDFESLSKNELDSVLSSFYVEARTKTGELYKKTSLDSIRYGLNRFLKQKSQTGTFDLLTDAAFDKSNESYKTALRVIKAAGKSEIDHYPPVPESDLEKLSKSLYFNVNTPVGLQNKVQWDARYYFGKRGGENISTMTKSSLIIKTDPDTGLQFVVKADELEKNHRENDAEGFSGNMFETGTADCPVAALKKYVSKLHPNFERLWCYPKDTFNTDDDTWYTMKPIGVNTLNRFLPGLSKLCGLSQSFTNHSIRATMCTTLHQQGFQMKDVQSVSGHKSLQSLAVYQRTSTSQKHMMSRALYSRFTGGKENAPTGKQTTSNPRPALPRNTPVATLDADNAGGRVQALQVQEGGQIDQAQIDELDLDFFLSDANEPEDIFKNKSMFRNCTIGTININIVQKQ